MGQGASAASRDPETFLAGVIDDIYSAPLEPDLWPKIIKRIVDGVNGATGQLVSPSERALTNLWVPHGFGREAIAPYAEHYHKLDVWTQGFTALQLPPCTVLTGEQMVEFGAFMRSEYYNDFLKPYDFQRLIACFVDNGDQEDVPKTSLAVYRPPGAEPFDQQAVALLSAVAPHVRRAVHLHWRISDLEHERAANTAVLEQLSIGAVLVDETCCVTYLNPAAQASLQANDGLIIVNGELGTFLAAETAELSRLLAEAVHLTITPGGAGAGTMTVSRKGGRAVHIASPSPQCQPGTHSRPEGATPQRSCSSPADGSQRKLG